MGYPTKPPSAPVGSPNLNHVREASTRGLHEHVAARFIDSEAGRAITRGHRDSVAAGWVQRLALVAVDAVAEHVRAAAGDPDKVHPKLGLRPTTGAERGEPCEVCQSTRETVDAATGETIACPVCRGNGGWLIVKQVGRTKRTVYLCSIPQGGGWRTVKWAATPFAAITYHSLEDAEAALRRAPDSPDGAAVQFCSTVRAGG